VLFLFDLFSKHRFEDVAQQNPALPTNKSIRRRQVHLSVFIIEILPRSQIKEEL
jgi:hypothetical protein